MRAMKDSGVEWIGEIPEGWECIPVKRVVNRLNNVAISSAGYIGLENVQSWTGNLVPNIAPLEPEGQALSVAKGNLIFGKLRPYLAKCYLVEAEGCCSSEFLVLDAHNIWVYYLKYLLLSPSLINEINMATYGTKMPRANWEIVGGTAIPIPPPAEQQRIAAYLDEQCSEIDKVLAKTRESIEEYKKLKQSVITEAVTKGIRPDRPMKPSGIEWIGDIPAEWEVVKLKRLAKIETGNTPPKNSESIFFSRESGYLWIKAENLGSTKSIEETTEYLTEEGIKHGRLFPAHSVFVCCIASVGKVGFCSEAASCNQQINALSFINAHWKYGFYLTVAQETEYLLYASGNVMKIINSEKQSNLMCPLPQLAEQAEIVAYLDQQCAEIDRLIAKKEQIITELESYKKSLIYECVTGKREVE